MSKTSSKIETFKCSKCHQTKGVRYNLCDHRALICQQCVLAAVEADSCQASSSSAPIITVIPVYTMTDEDIDISSWDFITDDIDNLFEFFYYFHQFLNEYGDSYSDKVSLFHIHEWYNQSDYALKLSPLTYTEFGDLINLIEISVEDSGRHFKPKEFLIIFKRLTGDDGELFFDFWLVPVLLKFLFNKRAKT